MFHGHGEKRKLQFLSAQFTTWKWELFSSHWHCFIYFQHTTYNTIFSCNSKEFVHPFQKYIVVLRFQRFKGRDNIPRQVSLSFHHWWFKRHNCIVIVLCLWHICCQMNSASRLIRPSLSMLYIIILYPVINDIPHLNSCYYFHWKNKSSCHNSLPYCLPSIFFQFVLLRSG